jgi:hypothetical protein
MVTYYEHVPYPPILFVNCIYHQSIWNEVMLKGSFYELPHLMRKYSGLPPYRRVLVIGAGAGNDVNAALMHEASQVDAVEIDPVIASIGRLKNKLKPYQDPRVRLIVDDGRSVLTCAKGTYDLIVFALTDSLVRVSSLAQLRLENFLFTRDSFDRAYRLLSTDGDLVFYNFYRQAWFAERMRDGLRAVTGKEPMLIDKEDDFYQFKVGRLSPSARAPGTNNVALPTDDWPFPYLKERGIPRFYLTALAFMAVMLLGLGWLVARLKPRNSPGNPWSLRLAFFAMGSAFLLLESKSVVQFSLLFGTTWWNSSIVFLTVLLLVLAANRLAIFLPASSVKAWIPGLLLASCFTGYFIPLTRFLYLENPAIRLLLAALLLFLPIFFANLLFSVKFRNEDQASDLFGWNLLGAALGGVLEYSSMMVGYNALGLIVAVLYGVAIWSFSSGLKRGGVGSEAGA